MLEHVPSMKFLLKKGKDIEEDDTSESFTFKDNLRLEFSENSKSFTVKYEPVDMRSFAGAVFPKLKEYMNIAGSRRKRRSTKSNQTEG